MGEGVGEEVDVDVCVVEELPDAVENSPTAVAEEVGELT